jgi:flagellar basal body-associated protein FliL
MRTVSTVNRKNEDDMKKNVWKRTVLLLVILTLILALGAGCSKKGAEAEADEAQGSSQEAAPGYVFEASSGVTVDLTEEEVPDAENADDADGQ